MRTVRCQRISKITDETVLSPLRKQLGAQPEGDDAPNVNELEHHARAQADVKYVEAGGRVRDVVHNVLPVPFGTRAEAQRVHQWRNSGALVLRARRWQH